MLVHVRAALASAAVLAALPAAEARELDAALKSYVIASCSDDAFRLCPTSLSSENDAVACMRAKRALLNQTCRSAYDKAVRTLRQ